MHLGRSTARPCRLRSGLRPPSPMRHACLVLRGRICMDHPQMHVHATDGGDDVHALVQDGDRLGGALSRHVKAQPNSSSGLLRARSAQCCSGRMAHVRCRSSLPIRSRGNTLICRSGYDDRDFTLVTRVGQGLLSGSGYDTKWFPNLHATSICTCCPSDAPTQHHTCMHTCFRVRPRCHGAFSASLPH